MYLSYTSSSLVHETGNVFLNQQYFLFFNKLIILENSNNYTYDLLNRILNNLFCNLTYNSQITQNYAS